MKIHICLFILLLTFAFNVALAQQKMATLTYLKSVAGEKNNLKEFLIKNWLAMDSVAKNQQLIEDFNLWQNKTESTEWDFIVFVQYKNEQGYDGIATEFEKIRSKHKKVLINNKDFKELGRISKSESVLLVQ
ncbi:MAG: hypothetical protein MUF68_04520 [Cyclobacteriaceae bacterium]|jgi:hypothetical protein|nr:hypothetical protein [Cyclobacteriaceae bacterium]